MLLAFTQSRIGSSLPDEGSDGSDDSLAEDISLARNSLLIELSDSSYAVLSDDGRFSLLGDESELSLENEADDQDESLLSSDDEELLLSDDPEGGDSDDELDDELEDELLDELEDELLDDPDEKLEPPSSPTTAPTNTPEATAPGTKVPAAAQWMDVGKGMLGNFEFGNSGAPASSDDGPGHLNGNSLIYAASPDPEIPSLEAIKILQLVGNFT